MLNNKVPVALLDCDSSNHQYHQEYVICKINQLIIWDAWQANRWIPPLKTSRKDNKQISFVHCSISEKVKKNKTNQIKSIVNLSLLL